MPLYQPYSKNKATVFKPTSVINNDPIKCKAEVAKAKPKRPCDNMVTTSAEKLEKVVRAPKNPVTSNKRQAGSRSGWA